MIGSRTIYPLLLIYSASSATTTIACLATLLSTPVATDPAIISSLAASNTSSPLASLTFAPWFAEKGLVQLSITTEQRLMLLGSYVPFLLVPLGMCFDMAIRVGGLIAKGIRAEEDKKSIKSE